MSFDRCKKLNQRAYTLYVLFSLVHLEIHIPGILHSHLDIVK